ncbi:MAG: DUF2974 domain-containing protein [Lachnospiraceae bacterium]|nr:DUF2974 domain-containing protein [Lachnospiraceae bacterium]
MAYTEQELLLLSNFIYIPACLSERPIEDIIGSFRADGGGFTEESVYGAAAGGGMSTAEVKAVFEKMDERIRENPEFGRLSAARCLEEKDIRAICYTDDRDEKPVVVFRGTGGTKEAWTDNFEGAFAEDTRLQALADDFIESECSAYSDIEVTGHSKGGNLAQYVTVKSADRISRCVSYDGQGFGDEFIRENADAVAAASPKIISISAYNDFVNILLTGIAGTCIYVANDTGPAYAHSPVTLLTENSFGADGSFTSVRSQGAVSKGLGRLTDAMCRLLDPVKSEDKGVMSRAAGLAISLALTTPDADISDTAAPVMGMLTAEFVRKLTAAASDAVGFASTGSMYLDADRCRAAAMLMSEQVPIIISAADRVDNIRRDIAYTISTRIYAEHALERVCERLRRIRTEMEELMELIRKAVAKYEKTEESAALMFPACTDAVRHGFDDGILLGE